MRFFVMLRMTMKLGIDCSLRPELHKRIAAPLARNDKARHYSLFILNKLLCVCHVFGERILGLYIDDSESAISLGMLCFKYEALPYFISVIGTMSASCLRGMGYSLLPLAISVFGNTAFKIIWLLTVFKIPTLHMPQTIYITDPITWVLTSIVLFAIFSVKIKKQQNLLN